MFRSPQERNEALGDVSIFKNKLKSLRFAYVSIKSLVRKRKRKKERKKERKLIIIRRKALSLPSEMPAMFVLCRHFTGQTQCLSSYYDHVS